MCVFPIVHLNQWLVLVYFGHFCFPIDTFSSFLTIIGSSACPIVCWQGNWSQHVTITRYFRMTVWLSQTMLQLSSHSISISFLRLSNYRIRLHRGNTMNYQKLGTLVSVREKIYIWFELTNHLDRGGQGSAANLIYLSYFTISRYRNEIRSRHSTVTIFSVKFDSTQMNSSESHITVHMIQVI